MRSLVPDFEFFLVIHRHFVLMELMKVKNLRVSNAFPISFMNQ